jgi:16S rRNA (cytosine967-C5)-methyltransferase
MELVYGSLRHFFTLERLVVSCLDRPLRNKDQDIMALLLVGAYQLLFMRIPDHAAINETVAATGQLKKPWARGLVNAVLRKIAAQGAVLERSVELPEWLHNEIREAYPAQADDLIQASIERAPMSVRVNVRRVKPDDYLSQLAAAGITAYPGYLPEHLVLETPVPARDLPGHQAGLVSIQDSGAQLLTEVLPDGLPARARILDACAAPGGKLFHLAERLPDAELIGVELSAERLATLEREAERLGHDTVKLVKGDATDRNWVGADAPFDLILLDAPCSGTGTLRRHPDIKILRKPEDLTDYQALQQSLLANLWPLVKPGGCLIYCTCSVLPRENDEVIEAFLSGIHDPLDAPRPAGSLGLPVGLPTRHGWQLLPLPAAATPPNLTVDGFYFARMTRQEKAR